MTKEKKQALEAAIVSDLNNPHLTYLGIAYLNKVGYATVVALSKKHSLTRTRGRKKNSLLSAVEG
jgi:hypothetical protein